MTVIDLPPELDEVAAHRRTVQCGPQRLGSTGQVRPPEPFAFMELQDVHELTQLLRTPGSAHQVAVTGTVNLDEEF